MASNSESLCVPDGVGALFSRDQMLGASELPFPPEDICVIRKREFHRQFLSSCRSIANGLSVYGKGKDSVYRYHFSPGAYRFPDGFDMKWIKPFLSELIPGDPVAVFLDWFRAAFPGFREIRLIPLDSWDYRLEILLD